MPGAVPGAGAMRSEEHTSELQSRRDLVCRLLLEKKKNRLSPPCWGLSFDDSVGGLGDATTPWGLRQRGRRGPRPPPWTSFFFFNDTATTEIYTLSLHDALPI